MAYATVTIPGDGSTTLITASFALGEINQEHVTVRVTGEVNGSGDPIYRTYTKLGSSQYQVDGAAAPVDQFYVVERRVPKEELLVDWEDNDAITEANLNTSQKQAIMIAHEALDQATFAVKTVDNTLGPSITRGPANTVPIWNTDGDLVIGPSATDITGAEGNAAAAAASAAAANTSATQASTAAAAAVTLVGIANTALQPEDIGIASDDKVAPKQAAYNYVLNKEIILGNIPGFDPTGVADSYTALAALQAEHAATGFQFKVPRNAKLKLGSNFVLTHGQSLVADRPPADASGVIGNDYNVFGNTIKLANNAHIRLDNGGRVQDLLIYRDGLRFNEDQGNFSEWTGWGVVLGYGNDQVVENCMVLGFDTCVTTLTQRGNNGPGRCILKRVYVDGKNGFKIVGSYDNAFFDILRAFCFVTQAYVGNPAGAEGYDPRKDRRPGVGLQLLDRADGTSLGRSQMFSYAIGYDINCGGWDAGVMMADYGTTTTYNSGGSGTIGILLRADTVPVELRTTDYSPCNIGYAHAWSSEVPIKIVGNAGRVAQMGTISVTNAYGDAIQIDGGGLQCNNVNMGLISGAPVRFLKAPDTKTTLKGKVAQFGAARNSNNVPAVKMPAGSNINLVDVNFDTDQTIGAAYYDNGPVPPTVVSADPITLPAYHGGDTEEFTVTGTAGIAYMFGLRPGKVVLNFQSSLTLFNNGAGAGGFRLPGNTNLVVAAGSTATFKYNYSTSKWTCLSYVA